MSRRKLSPSTQERVRRRANHLCEYCHTAEQWQYIPFTVDHVVPLVHGGTDSLNNLALACFHCNRRKSDQVTAVDPLTDEEVPLFHPRQHRWSEHFIWSNDCLHIIGITPTGRATIAALYLNRERVIPIRAADLLVKRHPPTGDPVQQEEESEK